MIRALQKRFFIVFTNLSFKINSGLNICSRYFYRLKNTDTDGRFTYSGTVRLNGAIKSSSITATPNPFTDLGNAISSGGSVLNS